MILWGMWQGRGKPQPTLYLKDLVEDFKKLRTEGELCFTEL